MQTITLTKPDDWHLHLRDGAAMANVVTHTAERFGRAIVMPNLKPPITTTQAAVAYRERILRALPPGSHFEPLMTLYLTDHTPPNEIAFAKQSKQIFGCKLYPAGATTNSHSGVTDVRHIYRVLAEMEEHDLPLLIHGEVTDPSVDVFDREKVFISQTLETLVGLYPRLRIVLEHITTRQAVEFVRSAPDNVAATITAHHLLLNRNAMFTGGIRPHHYCLPVLKREAHREALVEAATSGETKFFLGTDSAPHPFYAKENTCGCAGIFTAHAGIELYAEAFDAAGALDKLEAFASFHGPDFYRLPRNPQKITLIKDPWEVPDAYSLGESSVVPFRAGENIQWRMLMRAP